MMTSASLPEAAQVAFRGLFSLTSLEQSSRLFYPSWGFTERVAEASDEQINSWSGPGAAVLTVEGEQYGATEKYRGYPVTWAPRTYTEELSVTEHQIHWLNTASRTRVLFEVTDSMEGATQSLYYRVDDDLAKVFYLGFVTTNLTVGNSEALYASHTIRKPGASAVRNTFPSGETHKILDDASLVQAIDIMNRFPSHADIELLPVRNIAIVVSKENEATANKILNSAYGPYSPHLGLNAASKESFGTRSINIRVVCNPYITNARKNQWYLVDLDRAKKSAFAKWGWKPRIKESWEYRKGLFLNDGSVYFAPHILGWQWTFGSLGSGADI